MGIFCHWRRIRWWYPTAFLVDQTKMSPGHAKRVISYGNAREKAPHAHAAWADGRLSTDQTIHLFAAAEAVPDEYPDAEETLVEDHEPRGGPFPTTPEQTSRLNRTLETT